MFGWNDGECSRNVQNRSAATDSLGSCLYGQHVLYKDIAARASQSRVTMARHYAILGYKD